jgi:drug/metabolite transporter (DMT)-like permease
MPMSKPGASAVTQPSARPQHIRGRLGVYAALLFAVTVWGGSFVAARAILTPSVPGAARLSPTLLATIRFSLAALLFLPILIRQQMNAHAQRLKRADLPVFLLLGQLGISIYFLLQYTGVRLTNAGISAVLVVGLSPLATLLLARLTLREPLGKKRLLALALGAAGVMIVASQGAFGISAEASFLLGTLCLIANAFFFAAYSTLVRGIRSRYSPLTTTASITLSGAFGLLLLSLATDDWHPLTALAADQWLAILYLAAICSILGYLCYNFALTRIEASRAAVWIYLEPPIAVVLGTLLLGETITFQTLLGGLMILAGMLLAQAA